MEKSRPVIRKDGLFQPLGVPLCRRKLVFVFLYHGADDVCLSPLVKLLFDEAQSPLPKLCGNCVGLGFLSALGQLVQHGNVQIAVNYQRKGAGYGRCGHYQLVWIRALSRKSGTLSHAEAVLFVGNDKSQIFKFRASRNQGVSTHGDHAFSR